MGLMAAQFGDDGVVAGGTQGGGELLVIAGLHAHRRLDQDRRRGGINGGKHRQRKGGAFGPPECKGFGRNGLGRGGVRDRSEEHTSELLSLMRISYAVFTLKK